MMRPKLFFIILIVLFCAFLFSPFAFSEEKLTLTTYYPSPTGVFRNVDVRWNVDVGERQRAGVVGYARGRGLAAMHIKAIYRGYNQLQPAMLVEDGGVLVEKGSVEVGGGRFTLAGVRTALDSTVLFEQPRGGIEFTSPYGYIRDVMGNDVNKKRSNIIFRGKGTVASDAECGQFGSYYQSTSVYKGVSYLQPTTSFVPGYVAQCNNGWYETGRVLQTGGYYKAVNPDTPNGNNIYIVCLRHADNTVEWNAHQRGTCD